MDRNRRIILSILVLIVLSCMLAIIDVGLNMKKAEQSELFQITAPEIGPGIGVIRVYGSIRISDRAENLLGIAQGSDAIVSRLDEFNEDNKIKAILLRINSPGGTIGAVQEIYEKLIEIKNNNKIIVASMGDVAASGGYYIASACNYIFANHGTITGSIGVIASSPNLKGLFEKLGIKMNVIKSGKYKDLLASHRDMEKSERLLLQQMIDSSYYQFLKDVAKGRNLPIPDIKPLADGRVMNGEVAFNKKLIDEIGTYDKAIDKARELAKLPPDCAIYDEQKNPMQQLLMSIDGMLNRKAGIIEHLNQTKYTMIEYSIEP